MTATTNDILKIENVYEYELGLIKNNYLREVVKECLKSAPKCILWIPASSSGKYHPEKDIKVGLHDDNDNAFTVGGLVYHTKAVVGVAYSMINGCDIFKEIVFGMSDEQFFDKASFFESDLYADVAYASLILHDCMKPDDTIKHETKFDHPILASELFISVFKNYAKLHSMSPDDSKYMKVVAPLIRDCIASHMGQWNTAQYAKGIVLPKPSNKIELFVHMCDYIASRKYIDFNFDKYYID